MERRSTWMALFVLFLVSLLSPVNNLFQPHEKTNLYTDTEHQVAAMAIAAGLFVMVALVRKGFLCLNVIRLEFLPLVFPVLRRRLIPRRLIFVDRSPPSFLTPLRI